MKHILKTYVHDDAAFEENLHECKNLYTICTYTRPFMYKWHQIKQQDTVTVTTVICNPEITHLYVEISKKTVGLITWRMLGEPGPSGVTSERKWAAFGVGFTGQLLFA